MTRDIEPAYLAKILDLHAQGRSARYIALHVPVSRGTVRAILREKGLLQNHHGCGWLATATKAAATATTGPGPKWTPERTQDLALRNKTQTTTQIAMAYSISSDAVRAKLDEMGLEPFRQNKPAYAYVEPVRLEPVRFPRFEDVKNPDKDLRGGRKPLPETRGSLVGCAAAMCAG